MLKILRFGSYIFPRQAAGAALKLFLSPQKHTPPAIELEWKSKAELFRIDERIQAYRWGNKSAPKVLLVHGWSGRGTQLGAFAEPLVQKGYQVIAFDGPAHGESLGEQTNAGEFSRCLNTVHDKLGPFEAVISHSFGAGCTALAASQGLQAKALVLIACPADYAKIIKNYLDYISISQRSNKIFWSKLIKRAKLNPDHLHIGKIGASLKSRAMIIHDEADKEVPFSSAQEIKLHWQVAQLVKTQGLGHRRILKSPEVIEQVMSFISDANTDI